MVALQNLQYILVKASDNAEFTRTTYVNFIIEVTPCFSYFLLFSSLI